MEGEMKEEIKKAIEEYQCPGCVCGMDITCFEASTDSVGCGKHVAGTMISNIGSIFLGMPRGFNRLGPRLENEQMPIFIFEELKDGWDYGKFNVPTWKHKDKFGNVLIRGMCPRVNFTFIHIFLEDCMDKIDCLEITEKDISEMD